MFKDCLQIIVYTIIKIITRFVSYNDYVFEYVEPICFGGSRHETSKLLRRRVCQSNQNIIPFLAENSVTLEIENNVPSDSSVR